MHNARVSVVALAAALLGACGGGTPVGTGGTSTPTTASPSPPGSAETVTVGSTFWHAGWKVTLERASVGGIGQGPRQLTIDAMFENLGVESATFRSNLTVASAGRNHATTGADNEIPEVPGEAKQTGVIAILVDDGFTLADAVLTVGAADENQAIVPLGSTGTLVSLEPTPFSASGKGTITITGNRPGKLSIDVSDGEIRADIPATHREVDEGRLALTIGYAVTWSSTDIYSYYWGEGNLILKLPDGTSVGPDDVEDIPNIQPGETHDDWSARFIVKDPPAGDYVLTLKHREGTGERADISFTIA